MKKLILKKADDKRVYIFFLVAYRGPHGRLAVFAIFLCVTL